MDNLNIYSKEDVLSFVNQRVGEIKLGENVHTISHLQELENHPSTFVILGIPEDIGIRANYGIGGAKTAWESALKAFLNLQNNTFLSGDKLLILGHFEIQEPADQSIIGLRNKTAQIDALVAPVIEKIVTAGKIPIIIGGGHNNAYPIISGVCLGHNGQKINVVNIDVHADLRDPKEGRHSGNGFSTALTNNFLERYLVFGLQQNYVHQELPSTIDLNRNLKAKYFEELLLSRNSLLEDWNIFIKDLAAPCGLEIDLDSIENTLSSATTSSGFALNDIRRLILLSNKKFSYLHLCEGAIQLADGRTDLTTGKTIAYLMSDFIKALLPHSAPQPSS